MALSKYERQVFLFHLDVQMIPAEAEKTTVESFFETIQKILGDDDGLLTTVNAAEEDGDVEEDNEPDPAGPNSRLDSISILQIKKDNKGGFTILFQHGDSTAPDPALRNRKTKVVRQAGKSDDDDIAHSCHLVVAADLVDADQSCRAALERVPGVGRVTVFAYLNRLMRIHAAKEEWKFRDRKENKDLRYHPKLISTQHLSQSLKQDLKNGTLNQIELISHDVENGFDEENGVIPVSHRIVFKVVRKKMRRDFIALISKAKAWGKNNNFDEMQIRFKSGLTKRNMSPRFATELSEAADAVYSRLEPIGDFTSELTQCPTAIVDEVEAKMLTLLSKSAIWSP